MKTTNKKNRARILVKSTLFIIGAGLLLLLALGQVPIFQKIIYPYPHRIVIEKYASLYGVDPLLVVSVIREESKFLPQSESHKGAIGLMQIMPSTAQSIAKSLGDKNYNDQELLNPEKNIQYGTWYLASLKKEFANNTTLILAAYNGGRGHVNEWIKNDQINLKQLRQQDIPFEETRQYVERVLKSYQIYSKLYPVRNSK